MNLLGFMIPDNPNCQPNLETIFNLSRFFQKKKNTFISTETNACCIAYLRFSNSYKTEKTECFLCVVLCCVVGGRFLSGTVTAGFIDVDGSNRRVFCRVYGYISPLVFPPDFY
jgi:hypothetical protein